MSEEDCLRAARRQLGPDADSLSVFDLAKAIAAGEAVGQLEESFDRLIAQARKGRQAAASLAQAEDPEKVAPPPAVALREVNIAVEALVDLLPQVRKAYLLAHSAVSHTLGAEPVSVPAPDSKTRSGT